MKKAIGRIKNAPEIASPDLSIFHGAPTRSVCSGPQIPDEFLFCPPSDRPRVGQDRAEIDIMDGPKTLGMRSRGIGSAFCGPAKSDGLSRGISGNRARGTGGRGGQVILTAGETHRRRLTPTFDGCRLPCGHLNKNPDSRLPSSSLLLSLSLALPR